MCTMKPITSIERDEIFGLVPADRVDYKRHALSADEFQHCHNHKVFDVKSSLHHYFCDIYIPIGAYTGAINELWPLIWPPTRALGAKDSRRSVTKVSLAASDARGKDIRCIIAEKYALLQYLNR